MEPVTHLLCGLTVARAGANRLAPGATAAVVIGAAVPDLDLCFAFPVPPTWLPFHQGWTHSLGGIAALGAAVAASFWFKTRRQARQSGRFPKFLFAAWLGLASHLLLDATTARGARFFWPVDLSDYALDWFPRTDPWVLAVLLLGLAVPALLRLISEEIGAQASATGARRGAWAGLTLLLVLAGMRASLQAQAVGLLDAQSYRGRTPLAVGAFPRPVNPFRWNGVVETDTTYELVEGVLFGSARGVRVQFTYYKPAPSPVLEAAQATDIARTFLRSARFPLAEIQNLPDGYRVVLRDLRFAPSPTAAAPVVAWIELDQNLEVRGAGFGRQDQER